MTDFTADQVREMVKDKPWEADVLRQLGQHAKPPARSKYGNQRCFGFGIWWDSLRERDFAASYMAAHHAGHLPLLLPKPKIILPGETVYEPDFVLVHDLAAIQVVDVKSKDGRATKTKVYRLKARQVLDLWGVKIVEA